MKLRELILQMSRDETNGICCICGVEGKLSFEHVPPKAAFNRGPARLSKAYDLIQNLNRNDFDDIKTRVQQRGSGGFTLCPKCNNNTGAWYVNPYLDWVYQAAAILKYSNGKPSLYYQYLIFPLRVIKQIICMFFSANGPDFRNHYPDLVEFVLNPQKKYIDPEIQIFAYYNPTGVGRQSGIAGLLHLSGSVRTLSEISFFPFGYIMLVESSPLESNLQDISFFARYNFNDWKEVSLNIPSHEIYTWYPGDFRSREEVLKSTKLARLLKNKK